MSEISLTVNSKFDPLFNNEYTRYGFYGGRCSGKSYAVGLYAVISAMTASENIYTVRKAQNSLKESSYKLYKEIIEALGVTNYFTFYNNKIVYDSEGIHSEFHFKGLDLNSDSLRSAHNVTLTIVEEAQEIKRGKINDLVNTVLRAPRSRIVCVWNPKYPTNDVELYFRGEVPPPDSYVASVNYVDNFMMPENLIIEAENLKQHNKERFEHVWMGAYMNISEAQIFKNVTSDVLTIPKHIKPRVGIDFGYNDPNAAVLCYFIDEHIIYVERELYMKGDMDKFHNSLTHMLGEEYCNNLLLCDGAQPGRVNELNKAGFNAKSVPKPPNSVLEGVLWLQTKKIIVNPNCTNFLHEASRYCWDVNKEGDLIDTPVDSDNHLWDALRYALYYDRVKTNKFSVIAV